jgi:hypothetical protein
MNQPDISGTSARAWLFKSTPEERARKPHALDAYVIHQPGVHAFWSWWLVTGCDLYDDPDPTTFGKLPADKKATGNTHEFLCFALDPKHFNGSEPPEGWDATEEQGDPPTRVMRNFLTPQEFHHQEVLRDNEQANEVMRLFVKAVCDGHTAADADFRARNKSMLAATADHFRRGIHDIS